MLKILQKPFLIIYCFLLFISVPAMAEIDPYENTLMGPFQSGATFTVKDNKFQNSNYNWADITNFSVKDAVTLRVVDNVLIPYQFKYTVSLQINYYTDPNSGPTSVNRDLTVNYNPTQGVSYKGTDSYAFEGAYKITVTVLNVDAHGGTTPTGPVVQLSSNIVVNRQSVFKPQSSINTAVTLGDHNQVKLNWDFITGAEEYDIEWTTINSGNENFTVIDQQQKGLNTPDPQLYKGVLNQAFRNNASRVTTAKHDYVLSLLSTDTYFLLRIRQVQYTSEGVRLTGDWDYNNRNGGYAIIPVNWNEPGLNWQYSAAFAEEGKKKEVISYFDGTLRSRQTVTLNNSDSVAIAQETVYDEFGRKAASILPAPFKEDDGKSYLHYATNFNINPSGSPYSFLNLQGQSANCEPTPDPLNISSGASKYYSPNNSFLTSADKAFNKFIPDASGFPIAVTQYTSDNTGRVKLQGGVGLAFQPGAGSNGEASKTTKYYYGKPEQWELDQLFGNDVGYAEHYLKNMVVDPNGQISISYLNGSGKTIATALTGAPPANLKTLPSYSSKGKLKRTSLLKPEQFVYNSSDLKLTATTTYLASVTGPGTLTYNIQKLVSQYPGSAFQICSNCYYEMSVKVVNDCNEQVAGTSSPVQIGSMLANCADTARYQDSLVVTFNQIGEYHVTIEFAFNKDIIDQYTDAFITQGQSNGAVEKEFDYIKKRYLDSLDVSGCYADCRTCNVLLGGQSDFVQMLRDKFIAMDLDAASLSGSSFDSWANDLYTNLKAKCTVLQGSCDLSPCLAIQSQMQDDVSPGGQYALFSESGMALEPNINALTMFSNGSVDPNWRVQFPILPSTSEQYQSELITLDDGTQTSPYDAGFTIQLLIKYWKSEWGTKFLIYHPEYCKLQFCQTMTAFESWDQNVQQYVNKASDVPTIQGAANLSFNSSNSSDWLLSADPFFQAGAPGYNLQSQFRSDLLQYSSRVLGINSPSAQIKGLSEFSSYLLYCANPNTTTNTGSTANGDAWNNCQPNEDCRVPDREWTSYRDSYFELKEKYYTILRNVACGSTCPVGQPIAVPLAGDCPVSADFSISTISNGLPACAGGKTVLVAHDAGSLTQPVTVALYYPPGIQSSSLPQTIQFAAGESEKNFCLPTDISLDGIAIKSVACANSPTTNPGAPSTTTTTTGLWAYMSKENDRTITQNGKSFQAADFLIRIYKGGDANTHPDPLPANAYNYTGNIAYTIEDRSYPSVNNTSASFANVDAVNVDISSPNGYYSNQTDPSGNFDLSWYFTATRNGWLYLGTVQATPNPTTGGSVAGTGNCILPTNTTDYWAEATSKGINLLTNGDFSSGNTGFSSTYTYVYPDGSYDPTTTPAKGSYRFVTNPQTLNAQYYSFGDHTTGTGNMLYLDGGADPAKAFWNKTVAVEPNKTYVLSFWASTSTVDAANIQARINGAQVGKTVQLPNVPGWQNVVVQWDSGDNTSATITLHDLNPDPDGNDFAIDDMVFTPVCVVPATASCITPTTGTDYFAEASAKGINQISNGDFSEEFTGFSSTYTYVNPDLSYSNPNGTSAIGFYRFVKNPQELSPLYFDFGDHTTGSGKMLYLDGGADPTKALWSKATSVETNKTYVFSFWASTATANPAILQLKINGVQVGNTFPMAGPGWVNLAVQWNSGNNTSAILTIHDLNTDPGGNDFALDDFVFAPVCGLTTGSPTCITPSTTTNYWTEATSKGINLAANGDFSSGTDSFSSALNYVPPTSSTGYWGALSSESYYTVTSNPQIAHSGFSSFGDHTSGSGNMMVINGGVNPTDAVWQEQITVQPNKTYAFSFWAASAAPGNPANLQLSVDGVLVGRNFLISSTVGQWVNFTGAWTSGSNTTVTLKITNIVTEAGGNDFVLDDIVFAPVCDATGCSEAYTYKQSRFPSVEATPLMVTTSAQGNKLLNDTKNSIIALASDQFKAQSVTWMARLTPGLDAIGADAAVRAQLQANLVAICLAGGDLLHPYGSSTLPSGTTTPNGYSSFGDAIKAVLGTNSFTTSLNPWLIDAPYPYLPLQQSVEKTISATSNEICGLLAALSQGAQANNMDLYSFLVANYHDAMTLTPAEVASLQKSCSNCRFILPQDITLPVFLEPGTKGCIVPPEYAAAKNDLDAQFDGGLNTTDPNYETIFSNFMNHRWGFSLTFDDYKQFENTVANNPGASLCNTTPYSSTDGDPYACIKSAMEVAVANGEKDYNTYIEDQKTAFRANYISTCSLAQANAGLAANQQVYHYTLYYYDQADNLVRTIPPEGVALLTDNEIARVANYRKNSGSTPDCGTAYDWTTLDNSSITDALSNLGGKINASGDMAVEMWLYNAENPSSQVLLTTANRNYMFHTSILGKYLTVEVYTFDPNSAPEELKMVLSNRVAADISALLPLNPWSHIVIQGADLSNSTNLSLYLNGTPLTLLPNPSVAEVNSFQISSNSYPVQAPDNYPALKHLRLYNRLMDYSSEIVPNANNNCFLPARTDGMDWYRFNIPPAGSATTIAENSTVEYNSGISPVYPTHTLLTTYAYNSTNQVVQQSSPDGGTNRFWYDYISRPVISQNDKQLANNDYSYTAYDALGRITEVGQKNQTDISLGEPGYRYEDPFGPSFLSLGSNSQITQTIYDAQPAATGGIPSGLVQENLRKRVAASLYRETQDADVLRASYYNYDLDGNVKTLTQQVDGIGLKQLGYEYDLISGKVNFVRYQDGQPDQFYYKYNYDAENRITDAWSGTAAIVDIYRGSTLLPHNQKLDAHYDYYLHGPLARVELGDVYGKVQGIDYAYTLQGWLKGMNGATTSPDYDMGADGTTGIHSTIARDAHAMSLFYHGNDYSAIIGTSPFIRITDYLSEGNDPLNFTPLYNGNIAGSTNKLSQIAGDQYFHAYRYDQLNRLNATQNFKFNASYQLQDVQDLNETFGYDGNGNILAAKRNSEGQLDMDDLAYAYNRDANGKLINNKLRHVKDGVPNYQHAEDIDDQPDDNYSYDAIGNLTRDAQEGIDNIDWTVYGKIRSISKNDGTQLNYAYDPSGNRVTKTVNGVTTWYIRDAQGNTMGLYDNKSGGNNWREQHLYGSSRLGNWHPSLDLNSANGTAAWDTIGNKSYELVNHLGNVMATISDKRLQQSSDGTTIDYFDADVQSAQEYYAFGAPIKTRAYTAGKGNYRYGFNGKENDNEVKKDQDGNPNIGTQQDYGMRIYDPRLGRFLSVDPLIKDYPFYTPYQFAGNKPINSLDLDGLEEINYVEYFMRAWSGRPRLEKSEWLDVDRASANRTFAKAAYFNTMNGNSKLYEPINQIHNYYQWADNYLHNRKIDSKWFEAAEEVTGPFLGVGSSQGVASRFGMGLFSGETSKFLSTVNQQLFEDINMANVKTLIKSGNINGLTGKKLDFYLVEREQGTVQKILDQLKSTDSEKFNRITENISAVLNSKASEITNPYIKKTKEALGGEIDFKNQKHREALGKALVDELRSENKEKK